MDRPAQEQKIQLRNTRKIKSDKSCKQPNTTNTPWFTGGSWELYQNMRYIRCVQEYEQILENQVLRRSKKIFQKMAKKIKTRSPHQCRSHHQKICLKYKTLKAICTQFKEEITQQANFQTTCQQGRQKYQISFSQSSSTQKSQEQKQIRLESPKLISQEKVNEQSQLFFMERNQQSSWRQNIFQQSKLVPQHQQFLQKMEQQIDFISQFIAK